MSKTNNLQVICESGHVHVTTDGITTTFINCLVERVRPKPKDKNTSFIIYNKHYEKIATFTTSLKEITEIIL